MRNILKKDGIQSLIASLLCVLMGVFLGYLVLLCINSEGAWDAIVAVLKNYMTYSKTKLQLKNFGGTLVKTAPLLMCSLSVLFAYKAGLFNIGAAGQYCVGICACLFAALAWGWGWLPCILFSMLCAALWGSLPGILMAFCNVNVVISGIMLNWIGLYMTNIILTKVKESTSPYTYHLADKAPQAILPTLGLEKFFAGNSKVTIAVPLAILMAVAVYIVLDKTRFGYELKATGANKNAAKYCGMAEKRNTILTLAIAGALAGMGAAMLYLTDFEQWACTSSSVPGMGFSGIAASFLGGLSPIGSIFSSYFIQHITAGGAYVDKTLYCSQISDLISSLIIYLCGFVLFIKTAINKGIANSEEKELKKAAETQKGGQAK